MLKMIKRILITRAIIKKIDRLIKQGSEVTSNGYGLEIGRFRASYNINKDDYTLTYLFSRYEPIDNIDARKIYEHIVKVDRNEIYLDSDLNHYLKK